MNLRQALSFFLLSFFVLSAFGQGTYPLAGNIDINVCEGFLTDSDAGLNGQDYAHGENYTFTTCIPGSDSIRITFFSFCTEAGYDVMTFYDGPNTSSLQIGAPHSGQTLPPSVTATSGCLTIAWESDVFGVACAGWNSYWETFTTEPEPPLATFAPAMPTCSTEVVTLTFSDPVPCDSVNPGAFVFTGQVAQTVTSITPLNCVNGMGTSYQVGLSPGLDQSGDYAMEFVYTYVDLCGEEFVLEVEGELSVSDCPIYVEVFVEEDAVCPGECTEVWAEVTGGDPSTYVFNWANGLPPNAGPHQVCPGATTVYSLTVSDAGPAAAATGQTTVTLLTLPVLTPAGPVCENADAIMLSATPTGGEWNGSHMTNASGLFEPDTGAGMPWAVYTAPNSCVDSMQVTVFQVWAGFNQASCPNAAPFALTNAVPVGGSWSGSPFVTTDGTFTPSAVGVHDVTYTTLDDCISTKQVSVDNITVQADATVCESAGGFGLGFSPIGGSWSGAGVANWYWGWYEPSQAGGGAHTLTYDMNGCSETVDITVTAINAGNDRSVCPEQAPFQLNANPNGGTWSGVGVAPNGMYDPSVPANGDDAVLTYSLNGCTDQRTIYVRQTTIPLEQAAFCPYDGSVALNQDNTGRFPNGGNWSGPGTYDDNGWRFSPGAAGPGLHTIYYTANTCSDSMVVTIYENTMFDTLICAEGDPITLQAVPSGGLWYGEAITDTVTGTFDPQLVDVGLYWNYYLAPTGCWDSLAVDVYALEAASITGLASTYCFTDSAFVLEGYPLGGTFTGPGIVDSTFIPAIAGQGIHSVEYEQGAAGCEVQASQLVSVSAPILTATSGDTAVCPGQAVTLSIAATGGDGSPLQYAWDPNVTYFSSIEVYPDTTTMYRIATADGCSDPAMDSITVTVQPPFSAIITTSDTLCYGELGFATVAGTPDGGYRYEWNTSPVTFGPTVYGPSASFYNVTLTNISTGCTFDTSASIPSYPSVVAFFTPNPNGDCLGESDPVAEFLDLSQGAFSGQWDFGDGTVQAYVPGQYPSHTYADTGHYPVTLTVQNALGTCNDEVTFDMCVASEFTLFIPSAFTPDGDGLNDVLEIVSSGITDFEFIIYSRWGIPLHTQTSPDGPFWDGTLKGEVVQQGSYSYWVYARALDKGGVRFIKEGGFVMVLPRE
jgi:gliding motility-associated-like protein